MREINPLLPTCELFRADQKHLTRSMLRFNSALTVLRSIRWEPAHAEQVARLALMIFDQLESVHGLDSNDRDVLAVAGLLHDIGWAISRKQHHKHSMNLILAQPLEGFDANGCLLVANVARYHRRALPNVEHRWFGILSSADQKIVIQLAAILRVADGLDRTHKQGIQSVKVSWSDEACRIGLISSNGTLFQPEIDGAMHKADLFQEVFQRPLVFHKA